ncbi:MAG: hypothetical protein RJA63_569 [Pseudomonadota bacterium]|jgi:hypothetical protein
MRNAARPQEFIPLDSTKNLQHVLKFHAAPDGTCLIGRLPFIGSDHWREFSFWDVPACGGYSAGHTVGNKMALLFLKYLRRHGDTDEVASLRLNWVLGDMIDRYVVLCGGNPVPTSVQNEALNSLVGQIAGFFVELSRRLIVSVDRCGHDLDRLDWIALLAEANRGLSTGATRAGVVGGESHA